MYQPVSQLTVVRLVYVSASKSAYCGEAGVCFCQRINNLAVVGLVNVSVTWIKLTVMQTLYISAS